MNIALIGYGKMGREIESIATHRGNNIVLIVDEHNMKSVTAKDFQKADAVIEFTAPHAAVENIYKCFDAGVPVVVGTTGWYDKYEEVKKVCLEKRGGLFTASNFSVGVNLFFQLNKYLAELMQKYSAYDVSMEEHHHIHKKDAPSGTGITIAEGIIEKIGRKKKYAITQKENNPSLRSNEEIYIEVKREGEIPGTHIVKYQSAIDDIEIKHVAHNRKGFALGAVLAAEFMAGQRGVFGMNDLMGL